MQQRLVPKIIKTTSYEQTEILQDVIKLYCPNGFDLDPTYSKGNFYKNGIPIPKLKFDINPQTEDTKYGDCTKLPLDDMSINSIIFDPPFIAGIQNKSDDGIIINRFGSFKNVSKELWNMYHNALREFYRILKPNGVLVFKCQDTIDSCKQCLSHVEVINYAIRIGFYPKDLFVLLARSRLIGKYHHKQQHARKFHSYFIVFIKQKCPVQYTGMNKTSGMVNNKSKR